MAKLDKKTITSVSEEKILHLENESNVYLFRKPILDLVPKKLHERSPIFLGSKEDVEDIMAVIAKHKAGN